MHKIRMQIRAALFHDRGLPFTMRQHDFLTSGRDALFAAVLVLIVLPMGACTDERSLLDPSGPAITASDRVLEVTRALNPTAGSPSTRSIRDIFAGMARRIPGGFGGLFFDEDGILNIVLRNPAKQSAARAALANEAFIEARLRKAGGYKYDPATARIHRGTYTYAKLFAWYRKVLNELDIIPRTSSIVVRRNEISVGISNDFQREKVKRAVGNAGVPVDAVRVSIAPRIYLLHLRGKHRPVPGGVQVQFKLSGDDPICTIGPNFIRLGQEGFLIPSHCTKAFAQFDPNDVTHYWQHVVDTWYEPETTRHIGNEAFDPPVFACSENPSYGCRNSDAALALYNSKTDPDFGTIARPAGRNTQQLNLDGNNPRFTITATFPWSISGEILEKVGRTTGWSGGQVVNGCVSIAPSGTFGITGPNRRCSMIVAAVAGPGDSGSPVFRISAGVDVELRGMLWGGTGTTDEPCWQNSNGQLRCPRFIASNLGGIEQDLNPDNNAPLQYYPTNGGGGGDDGGGGSGGPDCPPNCLENLSPQEVHRSSR